MIKKTYQYYGILMAWFVSICATCGSLYFSEILHYEPCKLCWLQRICMYPLTVILGYAALTEDKKYACPAFLLSFIGLGIAMYHYLGQKFVSLERMLSCNIGVSCKTDYTNWLGFITIPLMALTAFTLILSLLWMTNKKVS
ncbi:disulfide oxidoreductase [Paenibacillus polymyxa]|uniref:disulfide oxidoreductase n=1 Tax=Paenibacillus polymyxa TaxID=1406 RepID=UPI00338E5C63